MCAALGLRTHQQRDSQRCEAGEHLRAAADGNSKRLDFGIARLEKRSQEVEPYAARGTLLALSLTLHLKRLKGTFNRRALRHLLHRRGSISTLDRPASVFRRRLRAHAKDHE